MDWLQVLITVLAVQALPISSKEIKTIYTVGYSYSQYFPLQRNVDSENTLRFMVKTARDAHIVLAPTPEPDGPVYEIVLGAQNNTINYIRGRTPGQRQPSATIRTVNLLNQQEFRKFWIRLKPDGQRTLVQVGLGENDVPYQEWLDPNPLSPQYLSFRSGSPAEWKYGYSDASYTQGISKDQKKTTVTPTGYGQYFPLSEVVSHSDEDVTLYFTVRTADDFLVLLSPTLGSLGNVYEIRITETGVYLSRGLGSLKATHYRDGLLNKNERIGFWIKLTSDGEIMLGTGQSPIAIFDWLDPSPLSPQYVSFTLFRQPGSNMTSNFAELQYSLGPQYSLASQDCSPRWKPFLVGQLAPGAIRAGYNYDSELFICRALNGNYHLPASFVPGKDGKGQCEMTRDWAVFPTSQFQTLTGCQFTWVTPGSPRYGRTSLPWGVVEAGQVEKNDRFFIGRVSQMRQVVTGILRPNRDTVEAVFNSVIVRPYKHFEVLTHN